MKEKLDVDLNVKDSKSVTPLHYAVLFREYKNVEVLIKLGANLNAQDF